MGQKRGSTMGQKKVARCRRFDLLDIATFYHQISNYIGSHWVKMKRLRRDLLKMMKDSKGVFRGA